MTPRRFNTALELYLSGTLPVRRAAQLAGCTERRLRRAAAVYGDVR